MATSNKPRSTPSGGSVVVRRIAIVVLLALIGAAGFFGTIATSLTF